MIIFDEKRRVEDLLKNGFQSKTALLDFILLGKYLIAQGYDGNELKNELIKILSDKQELIPASYLPTIIPKIIRVATNNPLQENKTVQITKKELASSFFVLYLLNLYIPSTINSDYLSCCIIIFY